MRKVWRQSAFFWVGVDLFEDRVRGWVGWVG